MPPFYAALHQPHMKTWSDYKTVSFETKQGFPSWRGAVHFLATVSKNVMVGFAFVSTISAATPVFEGTPPPATKAPPAAAPPAAGSSAPAAAPAATAPTAAAPAAAPVPPPSAAPKLSAAELEKLLMPIALYPDPLLATLLPASVYPLEVVQAQRFIQNTNNIANIDQQPWDDSVKALARIPEALKKLNEDLDWTIQLGEAFLNQDKDVTDTIQALRLKASTAGTLKTSEQQTIVVTNMVTEKTVEQQVVVVTNTVVQIQPSNPEVVYVPSYPPTVYAPPPAYVANPYAPLITFAAGAAMGAIIANNVDWNDGGCYWGGGGHGDIDIDNNVNIDMGDRNTAVRTGDRSNVQNVRGGTKQKWQPDQNRVRASGTAASTRSMESRGYSTGRTGTGTTAARATPQYSGASRPQGQAAAANRPAGAQAGSGAAASRAQGSAAGVSPASGARANASRPAGQSSGAAARPSNPSSGGGAARSAAASPSNVSAGARSGSGGGSAFSGGGARQQQSYSNRGSASRSGGGGGGGAARGGGGGGSRGGGGRR